jgi:DNA-binding transcriptional regulator YhcF (GntR family)
MNAKERNMDTVILALKQWFDSGKTYGPSYRDLAELSRLPLGTVHKTCHFLRDENVITFDDKVARSIRLQRRKK